MSVFDELENYKSPLTRDKNLSVKDELTPQERLFSNIESSGFDMRKIKTILTQSGNQLIISGAGSGKTTILIFLIQNDIVTGLATKLVTLGSGESTNTVRVNDNILVCTFTKAGTNELKERLSFWQRKWGYNDTSESIKFKTLHAEFMDVLRYIGVNIKITDADKCRQILKETCEKYRIVNSKTGYLSNDDIRTIEGVITYTRNRLDNLRYSHPECDTYGLTPTIMDSILYDMKEKRRQLGTIDYEDSQEILYQALKVNKDLQNLVAKKYSLIYIDEFQDTSQIQYEILKYYAVGCKKFVAIGDDDQTIYTWRGSDIDIILRRFPEDFKPTIQKLDVNYRCPDNILNPVISSIKRNVNRYEKELQSYNRGGELKVITENDLIDLTTELLSGVHEDMANNMNVAILTRTNYDGMIPAFMLEMTRKFNYSVSSLSMTANSYLPRTILDLSSILLDRCSPRLLRSLELIIGNRKKWEIRQLYEALKSTTKYNLFTMPITDISYTLPEFASLIKMLKTVLETEDSLKAYSVLLFYARENCYDGDSTYCKNAQGFIDFLLFTIDQMRDKGCTEIEDFMERFRGLNSGVESKVKKEKGVRIHICTVHEAKGREWDSVYIWKDIDGCFPSDQSDDLEEERRLHYIAWTRAKKKLTITTLQNIKSPFLMECDIPREIMYPTIVSKTLGKNKEVTEFSEFSEIVE